MDPEKEKNNQQKNKSNPWKWKLAELAIPNLVLGIMAMLGTYYYTARQASETFKQQQVNQALALWENDPKKTITLLSTLGKDAVPHLINILIESSHYNQDNDKKTTLNSSQETTRIVTGDNCWCNIDKNSDRFHLAAQALARIGRDGVEGLRDRIRNDPAHQWRLACLKAFKCLLINDPSLKPTIESMLRDILQDKDESDEIRLQAFLALIYQGVKQFDRCKIENLVISDKSKTNLGKLSFHDGELSILSAPQVSFWDPNLSESPKGSEFGKLQYTLQDIQSESSFTLWILGNIQGARFVETFFSNTMIRGGNSFTQTGQANISSNGVSFEGATFQNSGLQELNFSSPIFRNARLFMTDIRYCILQRSTWSGPKTQIEDCTFFSCDLRWSFFDSIKIKNVRFERCNLDGVTFTDSGCSNVAFRKCVVTRANFRGAGLTIKNFFECQGLGDAIF